MCPVPINSARAFVALGSWLVEGSKYVCRQGLLQIDLLLTAVGVEQREEESSVVTLFYSGRHVTPRGCWYSVKQDHQFLNKFPQFGWRWLSYFERPYSKVCFLVRYLNMNYWHQLYLYLPERQSRSRVIYRQFPLPPFLEFVERSVWILI